MRQDREIRVHVDDGRALNLDNRLAILDADNSVACVQLIKIDPHHDFLAAPAPGELMRL